MALTMRFYLFYLVLLTKDKKFCLFNLREVYLLDLDYGSSHGSDALSLSIHCVFVSFICDSLSTYCILSRSKKSHLVMVVLRLILRKSQLVCDMEYFY